MKSHGRMLRPPVMLMAGACLEFISGHAVTPPRWLGPLGLEWVHRFASDLAGSLFATSSNPGACCLKSRNMISPKSARGRLGFGGTPAPRGCGRAWYGGAGEE